MPMFLLILTLLGQDERKIAPETAIKTLLAEVNDLYKSTIKNVRTAKSSADRSDAIFAGTEKFEDWINGIESIPFEFASRIGNIIKDERIDTYYIVASPPRELMPFVGKSELPTTADSSIKIEISKEQKDSLKITDRIVISGKLTPSFENRIVSESGRTTLISRSGISSDFGGSSVHQQNELFTCVYGRNVLSGVFSTIRLEKEFVTFVMDDLTFATEDEHEKNKAKLKKEMANQNKVDASTKK